MKKVIIISRDTELTYPETCIAYKRFTTTTNSDGSRNIHNYVIAHILELLRSNPEEEHWNKITYKSELPNYDTIWGTVEDNYEDAFDQNPEGANNIEEYKITKIYSILNRILKPKEDKIDNQPYVHFQHNDFDVHFVFLNRIFDTFVNGSDEYGNLVDDASRLDFIKAICKDCCLLDDSGKLIVGEEKAILYIHDKEWYMSGQPYISLQNGIYTGDAYPIEKKPELAEFFSTIKVFLHRESNIFSEIKSLNFTEF